MIAINLNLALTDLDNNPVVSNGKPENLGKALAQVLTSGSKGNVIKYYDWAMMLWKGEELKLDEADAKTLRSLVEESDNMTILAKAQMLKIIDVAIASR